MSPTGLRTLIEDRSILITCGPGGVGKTTVAAAIGVAAARAGRHVVVVTVDPARRLADALGLTDVGNLPVTVTPPGEGWPGRLDAVMLDAASTFDDLVRRQARTPAQADAILNNPLYRNIASALSGTHEYMAIEKLHELATTDGHDLLVIDTPPSRNALDLLDAPGRLVRFLEHPLYRLFTAPSRSLAKVFGVAARTFLWTVKRVAGGPIVEDAIDFLKAFDGMEEGFRTRAAEVDDLLSDPRTAFVVVSSPRADALDEAWVLGSALRENGRGVDAVVLNLVHPTPGPLADGLTGDVAEPGSALGELLSMHRQLADLAASERQEAARLLDEIGGITVVELPQLDTDVHDLASLDLLAQHLVAHDNGVTR